MADSLSRGNKSALRRIASGNKRFAPFFQWAAEQPEDTRETRLDEIEPTVGQSRLQAVSLCKKLQEAGVGRFIAGRRGRPSRFEWTVDPRAVGNVIAHADEPADEDTEEPAAHRRGRPSQHRMMADPPALAEPDGREDEDRYAYRLRHDRQVHFALPIDLTQREAARLAEFVRALGLPDEPDGATFGLD